MTPDLPAAAPELAGTALRTVREEFPNGLRVEYTRPGDAPHRPRDRHPAFYGSYDWHSAVEMHWVLLRLLRVAPGAVPADDVRAVLDEHLTPSAIAAEVAFARSSPGWERPYGWAWALTLAEEAESWAAAGDPDAARWAAALRPLAGHFLGALAGWLPRATYPVRSGLHPNSAFGLLMALPAARRAADATELEELTGAALRWFADDVDAPVGWEPSGSDFLSPALTEARLMAEVLPRAGFGPWLSAFLPGAAEPLFTPAVVTDASDGQTAHLHGLNLSRAWGMGRLAGALPAGDPRAPALRASAAEHAAAALPHVSGSHYMVEHWLAAYALLYLDPAY